MNDRNTILIVDDAEVNRAILRSLFENDYNFLEAENGEQALMLLKQYNSSISVVLLDLIMPGKDGYQVMADMEKSDRLSRVPVIIITSDDTMNSKVKVFQLGAADIITKPFEPDVVRSRVKNIIELNRHRRNLEELVKEQSSILRESNSVIIDMLSSVIEHRSLESGQHIRRIRLFTKILLEDVAKSYYEYDLDERKIQLITDASSMHDIGKIAICDSILNKPGKLTEDEFEIMKTHTEKGCEILLGLDRMRDKDYLRYAYNICRYHHERWDGNGYPDRLKGGNIPICAQVVAIADCYDALTTDRVYKKAISQDEAFNMILNGECGAFSPRLLECFKNVRQQFLALSKEYADGLVSKLDIREDIMLDDLSQDEDSPLSQAQMKYFAMLRYADCTVMEVDFNTGTYHVVYLSDKDFESLRLGKNFEDAISTFAHSAVHPDDRFIIKQLLGRYIEDFFSEGLMRRSLKYRVLNQSTGNYYWCQASVIRVDMENPRQRKIMLIWHKEQCEQVENKEQSLYCPPEQGLIVSRLLGGVQKCKNDQYCTMVQINPGFLDLIGYSEEEVREKFQNRFIDFVVPADRERIKTQIHEQLNTGKMMELEYRLMAKDGSVVWVIDRCMLAEEDGAEYLYCILLDITKTRMAEEELRQSLERHKIIMDQTNDIIFEWDIKNDNLLFSSNWEKKFGYKPITNCVSAEIPKASHINPDDISEFVSLVKAMSSGLPYKEAEFRIVGADGKYGWYRARATALFDENKKPYKAVGVLIDVDLQKKASAELEAKAERDTLTKLYNKETGRVKIERCLKERQVEDVSALLVIDVDNFKQINDRYGHMFGDAVLTELASKISGMFRAQDIISRIGGDEFIVFMASVPDKQVAVNKIKQMIENVNNMLRENLKNEHLSCSVGVAYLTGESVGYQSLFESADKALYRAKAAGKNRYVIYNAKTMDKSIALSPEELSELRTQIDSDNASEFNMSNLTSLTFEKLYESKDLEQGVQSIIDSVGQLFNVSRMYVFENTVDSKHCCNTYEWCNDGIEAEKENLQKIPYDEMGGDYRKNFDENGIFYCPDIKILSESQRRHLEPQGILSMLQCAIIDEGNFKGFIGLDDCNVQRLWTKEQIDALTLVSKIISTFLLKKRAQEALIETVDNLHNVLNNQNAWVYVVEPDTYKLLYINEKTKQLSENVKKDMICYKALFNADKPCEDCLLKRALVEGRCTKEQYNPLFDIWSLIDVSSIDWGNKKSYLFTCKDISDYKKQN